MKQEKHYNKHLSGVECIDIIRYMMCNCAMATKYIWRLGLKDGESVLKDATKAINYLTDEIDANFGVCNKCAQPDADVLNLVTKSFANEHLQRAFGAICAYEFCDSYDHLLVARKELIKFRGSMLTLAEHHERENMREHFAGLAMQGLLANSGGVIQASNMRGTDWCNSNAQSMAELSIECADALLKELEK